MNRLFILFILTSVFIAGCSSPYEPYAESYMAMKTLTYEEQPTLTSSLFKSDQAVMSDEAIGRILASKVVLPDKAKIAIMKFPGTENGALRYYGYYYWRSEDYLKTQQEYIDTLSNKLQSSDRIGNVVLLPSLLTPNDATIPVLREAAVRLQADLMLVFRLSSDIYHRPKFFSEDQIKAYCTCEAVLLDVRTGIIPFTAITTREVSEKKEKKDMEISETMKRAETAAVVASLNTVADKLANFLTTIP